MFSCSRPVLCTSQSIGARQLWQGHSGAVLKQGTEERLRCLPLGHRGRSACICMPLGTEERVPPPFRPRHTRSMQGQRGSKARAGKPGPPALLVTGPWRGRARLRVMSA